MGTDSKPTNLRAMKEEKEEIYRKLQKKESRKKRNKKERQNEEFAYCHLGETFRRFAWNFITSTVPSISG
jgi:hypothetical protein